MDTSKKRYDKKHKVTRIFLTDYLALKEISQRAGVSMAEALHRLIAHQAQLPLLDMRIKPMPAFEVTAPITLRVSPQPTITTNGHKAVTIGLKGKGVRYA